MILGFVILYVVSFILEFGIGILKLSDFFNQLFDEGYIINMKYYEKLNKKYKHKHNILDFIPILNIFLFYFEIKKLLDKIRKDPAFINNLEKVSDSQRKYVEREIKSEGLLNTKDRLRKFVLISNLSDAVNVRYDGVDLGAYSEEELQENNGILSDDVLDTMTLVDKEFKYNEGKAVEQSFYTLSGEYNLSEVYRIDENATFIKTPENTYVAIVGATEEEIGEFLKKSLVVKGNLDAKYHIISLKPFDKNLVRRALVEMEYLKQPIDGEFVEVEKQAKKTL